MKTNESIIYDALMDGGCPPGLAVLAGLLADDFDADTSRECPNCGAAVNSGNLVDDGMLHARDSYHIACECGMAFPNAIGKDAAFAEFDKVVANLKERFG